MDGCSAPRIIGHVQGSGVDIALVRGSWLGYPQGSHIALIAEYARGMWRRDTSFGRAEALLNRDVSNVKISRLILTSHNRRVPSHSVRIHLTAFSPD